MWRWQSGWELSHTSAQKRAVILPTRALQVPPPHPHWPAHLNQVTFIIRVFFCLFVSLELICALLFFYACICWFMCHAFCICTNFCCTYTKCCVHMCVKIYSSVVSPTAPSSPLSSGDELAERGFFVRMKSTLTKRGLHVKSSGYKVGLIQPLFPQIILVSLGRIGTIHTGGATKGGRKKEYLTIILKPCCYNVS